MGAQQGGTARDVQIPILQEAEWESQGPGQELALLGGHGPARKEEAQEGRSTALWAKKRADAPLDQVSTPGPHRGPAQSSRVRQWYHVPT